jgi:outer membrane receptor protein involved in Fe transport
MEVRDGSRYSQVQRQINLLDTFSWSVGAHQLKFGIDYRRINTSEAEQTGYGLFPSAFTELRAGTVSSILLSARDPFSVTVNNSSLFAQDTWKTTKSLMLT